MTLDDFERPKRTIVKKSFYGAHHKNFNKGGDTLSAAKYK